MVPGTSSESDRLQEDVADGDLEIARFNEP